MIVFHCKNRFSFNIHIFVDMHKALRYDRAYGNLRALLCMCELLIRFYPAIIPRYLSRVASTMLSYSERI